jgi:hypothetical protein
MEGRDVDAGITQRRRETPDETGFVQIRDVDHALSEPGVHADALDVDDARPPVGKDGAGYAARLPFGHHRHGDQALVIARRRARHFLDHDAAFLGDDRRRHHVDLLQHGPQQPGDGGRRQRLGVHLGDAALVRELHLDDAGLGELAGERAELFRQIDEWAQPWRFFGGDRRKIDRVGDRAA